MLRRSPTQILLEKEDVSDVREFMSRKKLADEAPEPMKEDDENNPPFVAHADARRKREAMTRDDRLGVQ